VGETDYAGPYGFVNLLLNIGTLACVMVLIWKAEEAIRLLRKISREQDKIHRYGPPVPWRPPPAS
jgi:hypothetical protein